jgi:sec-independent protein translocase protein TatB
MFDFSFSEIALIGVVAVVVIGPERLPKVARTTGVIVGRIQRYAAAVRADIAREVELSELRRVQNDLQDAAKSLETNIQNIGSEVRDNWVSAESSLGEVKESLMTGPPLAASEDQKVSSSESLAPRMLVYEPTQQDLALEIEEETPRLAQTPLAGASEHKV